MAIETQCHGCGKRLRVGEQFAGRQARCPECGYVYTVSPATGVESEKGSVTDEQPLKGPAASEQPLREPRPALPPGGEQVPRTSSTASTVPSSTVPPSAVSSSGPLPQSPPNDDSWYMKTPEGQIYGPVRRTELDEWTRQGRVSNDCQLRPGEYGVWENAAVIYPHLTTSHVPPANTGGTYANPYSSPQASPGYRTPNGYVHPHRGALIITFAILGWTVCPIFSGIAWAMGTADMKQMRNGLMDNSGIGTTQAGQILGMIHTCLCLLAFGFFFLLILCGIAADAA